MSARIQIRLADATGGAVDALSGAMEMSRNAMLNLLLLLGLHALRQILEPQTGLAARKRVVDELIAELGGRLPKPCGPEVGGPPDAGLADEG